MDPMHLQLGADEIVCVKLKGSTLAFLARAIEETPMLRRESNKLADDFVQAMQNSQKSPDDQRQPS